MKRLLSLLAVFALAVMVWADAWTPETLPVPANTTDSTRVSYVSNPDGVLSAAEVSSINAIMQQLESRSGVRGLIIAIKEMDPDDPYQFTIEVGNKHGIGGKSNTGFIIMVSTVSRGWEIMPGEGMEKFLTDGQCSAIGRIDMVPLLKEEKWAAGIMAALTKIQGVCYGEEELAPEYNEDDDDEWGAVLWFFGILFVVIGLLVYVSWRATKCPKCGKHTYKLYLRKTVLAKDVEGAPTDEEVEKAIQDKLAMMMQNESDKADAEAKEQSRAAKAEKEEKEALERAAKARDKFSFKPRKVRVIDVYRCSECGHIGRKEKIDTTNNFMLGAFTAGAFGAIARSGSSTTIGGGRSSGGGGSSHSWGSSGGGSFGGGGAGGRF